MIILLRYFSREVLSNTLGVGLVLLLIFLSQRFVKYLANAAAGDLEPAALLPLILYRIPGMLELILPLALFVALLLVYGRLYLDNEMRVLFSAGVSRLQLLALAFVPVLLLAGLLGFISMWLSPWCLSEVQSLWQTQENRSELDSLSEGKFHPFRNGSGVIYVEHMSSLPVDQPVSTQTGDPTGLPAPAASRAMDKVYIFQGQGGAEDETIIVAERGSQITDARGRYLLLENGYRMRMLKESRRMERIDFARYGQHIAMQSSAELHNLKVDALPSSVLSGSSRADYQVTWHWRLSLIVLMPVVALLAIAFGKADPRQGRYMKVLPAILLYLVYLVLLNVVRDRLMEGKLTGMMPFLAVHGFFFLLGAGLLAWEDVQRRYVHRSSPKASIRPGSVLR